MVCCSNAYLTRLVLRSSLISMKGSAAATPCSHPSWESLSPWFLLAKGAPRWRCIYPSSGFWWLITIWLTDLWVLLSYTQVLYSQFGMVRAIFAWSPPPQNINSSGIKTRRVHRLVYLLQSSFRKNRNIKRGSWCGSGIQQVLLVISKCQIIFESYFWKWLCPRQKGLARSFGPLDPKVPDRWLENFS